MPSVDEQLLEIYKGEFAPPSGWDEAAAKAYRQLLNGEKGTGKIARFAPIGQITMGSSIIPDSFPFIQFSTETLDDAELLKRGTSIRNAMNKYDPYSTDAWEPIVLQNGRGDKVSYDKLKFTENIAPEGPRPKDPVVQYLKSLPPTPGPKMRIKSDAKSFQAANYSPDPLFSWTNGEIKGNQTMLDIHYAIKRAAGDYLLTLYEEHRNRMIETMRLIDYEIRQNVRLGTEGRYVNRYSMANVLANLSQADRSRLLYQIDLDDNTYELFNPVIDVDNKGFQKWKKYADNKRKKYNYFMSVLSKSVVNTDASKPDMKEYKDLNADAARRRAAIAAIQRVKAVRAAATATTAGSNAAAIQAQNDAVDQYLKDVKATTNMADLNNLRQPDTSLLPNKLARDTEMGQAVLAQESIFNAQPPPPPDYANMTLDEVSKLSEQDINANFTVPMLRKLLGYAGASGSKAQNKAFTNEKFFLKVVLIKKVQAKEMFDAAKAAKDKQRYEVKQKYRVGTCVLYDTTEVGTIVSLDLDKNEVGVEKYKGDGTVMTMGVDKVTVLNIEECNKRKMVVDIDLRAKLKQREEEERKKKEEQDRLAAVEKAEQDRLAAVEAKKKTAVEAARVAAAKAKKDRLDALPKLTVESSTSPNWFKLKQGDDIKFYASSVGDQPGIMGMIDILPNHANLIQYKHVEPVSGGVWTFFDEEFTIKPSARVTDSLLVTKNYGDALKDGDGKVRPSIAPGTILEIKNQAVMALRALHNKDIVHQDVKLDNMVWDGKNLTLIDLGGARKVENACEAQFNGDTMNILPPPELGDAKLGDYWSLVIALLNLGGKNLQPVEDVGAGGSSSITEALFTSGGKKGGQCYKVGADSRQKGLLFIKTDALPTTMVKRKKEITVLVNTYGHELFEYLWFVWNREDDLVKDLSGKTFTGIVPGYGQNPSIINTGKNRDNNDYLDLLTARMATNREDMARQWVQGHLRWNTLQAKLKDKTVYTATKEKILGQDPVEQFEESEFNDLGDEYYGIPTTTVVKIFKLLEPKADFGRKVILDSSRTSFLDLNYDSYSDAELDEFEASLEPYDEEELDKLMEGALTGMAKEAYDSSSDTGLSGAALSYDSSSDTGLSGAALSYDSSSDAGLSGAALSYDSSSDGGISGAARSYNSESEQSFHGSEHGASYDSDSDEDS
jgi:serine/threonine protein kinase